jgi:glycine/D-amino acid oxidase-like deaminating enzyme/nitrite reductase/ring-hydroxylating ferredoxin subunit
MSHGHSTLDALPATGINPSGHTDPIWYSAVHVPDRPPLTRSEKCDVVIVGAGIAGLTCAFLLAKAGKKVIVLDEKPIAGGESGRTSAHLASAIDDRFFEIERLHGVGGSRIQHDSHATAIDLIEQIAREERIDCDFERLDGFLFLGPDDQPELLDRELAAAHRAGFIGAERLSSAPVQGFASGPCIRFPRQARFHPLKYLIGLARAVERYGGTIYCGSRVKDLKSDAGKVVAQTAPGHEVHAAAGIAATNVPSPIDNWLGIYTKEAPYRTYLISVHIPRASLSDALYWDTQDPYHYVRIEHSAGDVTNDVLLVGGEDHKTGQHHGIDDEIHRFNRLEEWTRRNFPAAGEVVFRWSGQVNEPDDGVAFIGRVPTKEHENCYVITGDSGMGLTHGTLGGILVCDLILGRENPWARLYDPSRRSVKAAREFLSENLNVARQYVDYLTPGAVSEEADIPPGHGALMREGMTKVAVYRSPDGKLHKCSAACTHLQCIVQWNDLEQTWDCPCHGSRFTPTGQVITGPAIEDLGKVE